MANSPVIHNEGGMYNYIDFMSQIPDFLRSEPDVRILLQFFSDYLNNAYRNMTRVTKFRFKLIATDNNVVTRQIELEKLATLFRESYKRGLKMVLMSKPQGNPYTGLIPEVPANWPIYREIVEFDGTIETLSPSILTITPVNGDKIYVEFTREGQTSNTGVYVYQSSTNILYPDVWGTSQDPFTSTPNKPTSTVLGVTPRMLEFDVKNITTVKARRSERVGPVTYYEVFFDALIENITDVPAMLTNEFDSNQDGTPDLKYVVDYYNALSNIPSAYSQKYYTEFLACSSGFNWEYSDELQQNSIEGNSVFYARGLTQYQESTRDTLSNEIGQVFLDPSYYPNAGSVDIVTIIGDGTFTIITTDYPHYLNVGDEIDIIETNNFNGIYTVASIVAFNQFKVLFDAYIGTETDGKVSIKNLFYSKSVVDTSQKSLVVPYDQLRSSREFEVGDKIARLSLYEPLTSATFDGALVNVIDGSFRLSSLSGFANGDSVVVKSDGSTLPAGGMAENTIYELIIVNADTNRVKLGGVPITAVGSGEFTVYKSVTYVTAPAGVDTVNNTLTLNDLNGCNVGDYIIIRGELGSTLPSPLSESTTYRINAINTTTKTITLGGVTLTTAGSGIFEIRKLKISTTDIGVVKSKSIKTPYIFGSGRGELTMQWHSGDLISTGNFGLIENDTEIVAYASFESTSVIWIPLAGTRYNKDSYVTYNGNRYRVIQDVVIKNDPTYIQPTPDRAPSYYVLAMNEISTNSYKTIYNPYMWGLYKTIPLTLDESVDYTKSYAELFGNIYIQQLEEFELKYGYKQREWLFAPRLAPQYIDQRNGFMETVPSYQAYDITDIESTLLELTKADTAENIILFGNSVDVNRTISSISRSGTVATAVTLGDHGYKSGITVTIDGAAESNFNGTFEITVVDQFTFEYDVPNSGALTATGAPISTYVPSVGEYINVISQTDSSTEGIYRVTEFNWVKIDTSVVPNGTIAFMKQNLFDVDKVNTDIGSGTEYGVISASYVGSNTIEIELGRPHGYVVGSIVNINGAVETEYNGRFPVTWISGASDYIFRCEIPGNATPSSDATGDVTCQEEVYYQYTLDTIEWQGRGRTQTYTAPAGNTKHVIPSDSYANNFTVLAGLYTITLSDNTVITLYEGDLIELNDQLISVENGLYRVRIGMWERLDAKVSMKVRLMDIDAVDNESYDAIDETQPKKIYRTYTEKQVQDYIAEKQVENTPVYKIPAYFVPNYEYRYEYIENVDTAGSYHTMYNSRYDKNSVISGEDMKASFNGIPDMTYPIAEKVARLAYLKDPSVIDMDLIGYLARYMGYDITTVASDVEQNPYYSTPEEVDKAIRRVVENLPQYYSMKSTISGLEILMLTFGIIGELVTLWTPQDEPYMSWVPDFRLRNVQYAEMADGGQARYVPTPHFNIKVNVGGQFENQTLSQDLSRLIRAVERFKPINTVFNELMLYVQGSANASVWITRPNMKVRMSASIGYDDLTWTDSDTSLSNDCI